MPKSKKNITEMIRTFKMSGIALSNEITPSLSPSFLEIILRGLKTRISLRDLRKIKLTSLEDIETIETATIIKSKKFHMFLR
jgi:flagellar biosynthesis component FlhA